ncbi:hypothetical protein PN497_16585 [Sphaerospermopsis kisseleviana CS-549]|uniref:Uncharacterized protein n=1 Tax=Sphaerospermopsis kisseleviana CS-549 TaxID=3021783 RepID=A0ABT4ZU64_9CYAN|nr:hypothetical protein [Sphaerospermopsis kisseleviana]MDB9442966.1 hypothetical protein [Sphaerospermopsis kisseleviana CS-549]
MNYSPSSIAIQPPLTPIFLIFMYYKAKCGMWVKSGNLSKNVKVRKLDVQ